MSISRRDGRAAQDMARPSDAQPQPIAASIREGNVGNLMGAVVIDQDRGERAGHGARLQHPPLRRICRPDAAISPLTGSERERSAGACGGQYFHLIRGAIASASRFRHAPIAATLPPSRQVLRVRAADPGDGWRARFMEPSGAHGLIFKVCPVALSAS